MRARESGDTAVPARRPDPRARPSAAAAVLELQRRAGNRAARRLIQRDLEIFDKGLTFTDPVKAKSYLEGEYFKQYYQLPVLPAQEQRLKDVALTAARAYEVIQVRLGSALAYIHNATPANEVKKMRDPSLSPLRGPAPDWTYQMAAWSPTALEAPQSP